MTTQTAYPIPAAGHNWPLIDATRQLIGELPNTRSLDWDANDDLPEDEGGWNQDEWRCETGRCFAGWGATLAGAVFANDVYATEFVGIDRATYMGYMRAPARVVVEVNGETWHVADYAQRALGLTDLERNKLFYPDNTLSDIDQVIAKMRAEEQS